MTLAERNAKWNAYEAAALTASEVARTRGTANTRYRMAKLAMLSAREEALCADAVWRAVGR